MVGRFAILCATLAAMAAPLAATADPAPPMTHDEVMAMFAAGGFHADISGSGMDNRCGEKAHPRVTFIDLNNDRQPEALFIDDSPCYAPDGRWFAIATKTGGAWHQIAGATGTAHSAPTRSGGWQDIVRVSMAGSQPMHWDGTQYIATATPAPPVAAGTPTP